MHVMAIDPGPELSGVVIHNGTTHCAFGIWDNLSILDLIEMPEKYGKFDRVIIEEIAGYGMPVGKNVFMTVFWSGRFYDRAKTAGIPIDLIPRKQVKMHLCGNTTAKDKNIIIAIVDRVDPYREFGNYGKGTKNNPGPFYGFSKDVWQAYALLLTWLDLNKYV